MIYRTYKPCPPLSDFVELFWFHQGQDLPHTRERVLPNASMGLIINLHEDRFRIYNNRSFEPFTTIPGAILAGAHSEYQIIEAPNRTCLIGAHFKPGGGFAFLEPPVGEFHNASVSLELLWGVWAREMRERLLEEPTVEGRFQIFEEALLAQARRAAKPLERRPAVCFALSQFQAGNSVAQVTDSLGLSARRFVQVFSDEVGLTPKLFCRVKRFQNALGLIQNGKVADWTDLALTCGYFDQAHFNHDFRAFSGLNPTTYLASRSEYPNHVPLLD